MDLDFIRKALRLADLDAVRTALFHNTGDGELGALPVAAKMSDAQRESVIEKAAAWLHENAGSRELPEPPEADLRRMMEMAAGAEMGDLEFDGRRELPAFKRYPFLVEWDGDKPIIPEGFKVAIIGGGFSGIVMAVQCELLGIPYAIYERRPELGGTWYINRYPEVRVDTISITYEYSFEKSYRWSEYFGPGAAVRSYLDHVANKHGVRDKTHFQYDMKQATFDETRDVWKIEFDTPDGVERVEANILVSATGVFANPKIVQFEDQETFKGLVIHPSRWPSDLDLTGKRVAVIGNGSTGVQMLGAVARQAAQTYVFQRTPQWIMPRDKYGKPVEPEVNWLMDNFPGYWNWYRYVSVATLFETHPLVCIDEEWRAKGGLINPANDAIRESLFKYIAAETGGRQDIIDRVTPDYAPFARRPIVDNGWYRALTRDDVELVTGGIARLVPEGIVTDDGKVREVDIIVAATGYEVARFLQPAQLYGESGQSLHDMWAAADGPRAYIGMMVQKFPNFFMMFGPNSAPVSSGPSSTAWFTMWAAYVARCMVRMFADGKSRVAVKPEAYARYNAHLDAESKNLITMQAEEKMEKNYYVDSEHGRLLMQAPWYGPYYQQLCMKTDWDDLALSGELMALERA